MEDRMTAQQLKNSILQMAVQGKLVPQDPNDEPASVLLDRIRKEKEQLIKDGKIKKNKKESYIFRGADNLHYEQIGNEVKCIEDELPFEIPENWEWISLGTVLEIARGGSPRPIKAFLTEESNGVNWIKIGDTEKGGKYINQAREKIKPEGVSKSRLVHKGDFLLTNSMSFGRPYILNVDGCIHDGWLVLSDNFKAFDKDFLYYLLSSKFAYYQFCESVSGAVVKNLNSDKVAISRFAIPPINEQKRIANKIESLVPLIEKYEKFENELYELNSNIKGQLKKSILQYAIEGKLVPQDLNDEPATVLLERMHKEKEKLIADKKIKKDKNESMIYRRDNSYYEKLGDSEICIDKSLMFDIPISWCWVRIKDVFQLINGDRGKNYPSKSKLKNIGNIPFISAVNIQNGTISKDSLLYLSEAQYKLLGSGKLKKNDFVFCLRGSLGKNCKYPYTTGAIASSLIILRKYAFISDNYIELVLNSPLLKKYIDQTNNGTAQPNLGARDIAQYLIPLPPLDEQIEIYKQYLKITKLLEF